MPVPVINFSGYSTSGMKPPDLMQALQKGMQTFAMPKALKSEQQKMDLANALQRVALQYAPEMTQADLNYRQAQTPALQAQTALNNQQAQYYPQDIMSQIGLRGAQTDLSKQQAKFLPLQNAIEATRAMSTDSRFGQAYQLNAALKNMGAPAREAWIAQNPEAFTDMINTMANKTLQGQQGQSSDILSNMMKGLFPQGNMTLSPQDQQRMAQSGMAQQGVPQGQPQMQGQQQLPVNPVMAKQFATNPQASAELQNVLTQHINNSLTTAATRRQMEGAQQVEGIMNDPELQAKVVSAAEYAGAVGKGKAAIAALSQKNPKAFEDYISLVNQDMVLLQNRIKTLDQMGSTDSQREELHGLFKKTMNSATSNPKQFVQQFNELGKAVDRVGKSVQKSATPFRPGENSRLQGFKPIGGSAAQQTKSVGGKNYHLVNGQWMQE